MCLDRDSMLFRPLLPDAVLLAEMPPEAADPSRLLPEEARSIERAVEKRRREFAAARLLARALFARMTPGHAIHAQAMQNYALLNDTDRVPIWPAGIVGSITHCQSLCAVALAPANEYGGLGLDVEPAVALKAELRRMILRAGDETLLDALPSPAHALGGMLAFTIKEAVYKAIYPSRRRFLEFHDVEIVRLAADEVAEEKAAADELMAIEAASDRALPSNGGADLRGVFEVQVLIAEAAPLGQARIAGRFRIAEGHIAAAVVLPLTI
jgi:4'-phosphopantetheinyl transferase EntD